MRVPFTANASTPRNRYPSIQVPVSRRRAAGSICGEVMTPAPPGWRSRYVTSASTFGSHAALAELAALRERGRLGHGQAVEPALVGLAPVHGHLIDAGGDREQVGAQLGGQQRAGGVLVDDRLDALEGAVVAAHDGDATATAGDDDRRRPRAARGSSCSSTISTGAGDGTTRRQPRPASSATCQPSRSAWSCAVACVEERADRLGRVRERRDRPGRRRSGSRSRRRAGRRPGGAARCRSP